MRHGSGTRSSPGSQKGDRALESALHGLSPAEKALFVQYLDRKARAEGNLEYLRAIRSWRARQAPHSMPPPAND